MGWLNIVSFRAHALCLFKLFRFFFLCFFFSSFFSFLFSSFFLFLSPQMKLAQNNASIFSNSSNSSSSSSNRSSNTEQ